MTFFKRVNLSSYFIIKIFFQGKNFYFNRVIVSILFKFIIKLSPKDGILDVLSHSAHSLTLRSTSFWRLFSQTEVAYPLESAKLKFTPFFLEGMYYCCPYRRCWQLKAGLQNYQKSSGWVWLFALFTLNASVRR